jgi:DNA-binding GntR family transcriptional regulator
MASTRAVTRKETPTQDPGADSLEVLVDVTYEAIKRDILGNRLRPGTKLTHRMLAENLGVSRTPVRESLERLYQEGYVTRVLNRGYFVAEINEQEARELYQTREALESYALRLTFERGPSPRDLKPVQAINARYAALCKESLSHERVLVDREFHLRLASLSGNSYLVRTLEGIFDRIILKRRVEGYHDTRGLAPHADHVRLLEAISRQDQPQAQEILHGHIDSACVRLLRYLGSAH